jgi:hypothetical protein
MDYHLVFSMTLPSFDWRSFDIELFRRFIQLFNERSRTNLSILKAEAENLERLLCRCLNDQPFALEFREHKVELYLVRAADLMGILCYCNRIVDVEFMMAGLKTQIAKWLYRYGGKFLETPEIHFCECGPNECQKMQKTAELTKLESDIPTAALNIGGAEDDHAQLYDVNEDNSFRPKNNLKYGEKLNTKLLSVQNSKPSYERSASLVIGFLTSETISKSPIAKKSLRKPFFYHYRFGWVRTQGTTKNDFEIAASLPERICKKNVNQKKLKLEERLPKLQRLVRILKLKRMLVKSQGVVNVALSQETPAFTPFEIRNNHWIQCPGKIASHYPYGLYEAIADIDNNNSPLLLNPLHKTKINNHLIQFLNKILVIEVYIEAVVSRDQSLSESEEFDSYRNFEYLCYIVYFLRESLFLKFHEKILKSMMQVNEEICQRQSKELNPKRIELHFEALAFLFKRLFLLPQARVFYSQVLQRSISKLLINNKAFCSLNLIASFIINVKYWSNSSSSGCGIEDSEALMTLRSFIHHRTMSLALLWENIDCFPRSNKARCQTTIDLLSRAVNESLEDFVKSIWSLEDLHRKFENVDNSFNAYCKDRLEGSSQFKLLMLMIEQNPRYYTNFLQFGEGYVKFDVPMYIYMYYAGNQRYSRYYKNELHRFFSDIKSFLRDLCKYFGNFKNEEKKKDRVFIFRSEIIKMCLNYIASEKPKNTVLDLEDFKNIVYILFRRLLSDQAMNVFVFLKMVNRSDSEAALIYLADLIMALMTEWDCINSKYSTPFFGDLHIFVCNSKTEFLSNYNLSSYLYDPSFDTKAEDFIKKIVFSKYSKIPDSELQIVKKNVRSIIGYKLTEIAECDSGPLSLAQLFHPKLHKKTNILFEDILLDDCGTVSGGCGPRISAFEIYRSCKYERMFINGKTEDFTPKLYAGFSKEQSRYIKNSYIELQKNGETSIQLFKERTVNWLFNLDKNFIWDCNRYKEVIHEFGVNTIIDFADFKHFFRHLLKKPENYYNTMQKREIPEIYLEESGPMTGNFIGLSPWRGESDLRSIEVNFDGQASNTAQFHFVVRRHTPSQCTSSQNVVTSQSIQFSHLNWKKRISLRRVGVSNPLLVISLRTHA